MSNDVNYFLFPNNHDSKAWRSPPYDFNDITNSEYWPNFNNDKKNLVDYRVVTNIEKIMEGDVAFFWSVPYFSITTLGIILGSPYSPELLNWMEQNEDLDDFEEKFENDFPENYKFEYVVDLGLLQLGENNWIAGSDLEKLDEWKNKKPFVRNKDGSLNQQFATPKLLNNFETRSLKERIHKDGLDFISIENISKVIFALNRF
tara:strand:+ start:634 stop:1242 length:609 start_codon:yes stop_codon:yes gene_type:complete